MPEGAFALMMLWNFAQAKSTWRVKPSVSGGVGVVSVDESVILEDFQSLLFTRLNVHGWWYGDSLAGMPNI